MRKFLIILAIISLPFLSFSQFDEYDNEQEDEVVKQKKPFMDKLFYGGDFGLQFGTITYINISPQIGYYINDYVGIGVGVSYAYTNDKIYRYQTSMYGGSLFAQAYPIKRLIIHGEFLALNFEDMSTYPGWTDRAWDLGMLAGGGYRMTFGKKSAVNYMILWNFNDNEKTPYTNPVYKVSIVF